jgi:hypothetical protein
LRLLLDNSVLLKTCIPCLPQGWVRDELVDQLRLDVREGNLKSSAHDTGVVKLLPPDLDVLVFFAELPVV